MSHEFKLRHNPSKTIANINRACGDEYKSDRTIQKCFQKFRSVDQSLKDKKGRGLVCSLDNEQLQAIVEQTPQQNANKIFETLFQYPINKAVAVLWHC